MKVFFIKRTSTTECIVLKRKYLKLNLPVLVNPWCLPSLWHLKDILKAKELFQEYIQSYFIFNLLTLRLKPFNIYMNELNYSQHIQVRNDKAICKDSV